MTHLTRDELLHWRATGAPEARDRVLAHLAACGECRRTYAELVRVEPESIATRGEDLNVFVQRGIAAYDSRNAPAQWKRGLLWAAVPLAAAAMVMLAVNIRRPPPPLNEPSIETRGGSLAAISPAGSVDRVTEFRWRSGLAGVRYRIVVRDAAGREVLHRETVEDRLTLDASAAAILRPGRYTWAVEARDRNGSILTASPRQDFQVN